VVVVRGEAYLHFHALALTSTQSRTQHTPIEITTHAFKLAYFNDDSGYYMALCEPGPEATHTPHGGKRSEW